MAAPRFSDVDSYIAAAAPEVRARLEEIRRIACAAAPDAFETISYQMPALKQGRVFFYFAAFKNHIGVYPPVQADKDLVQELAPWRGPRGNLQFPLDQPLPYALIQRVVLALAREYSKP